MAAQEGEARLAGGLLDRFGGVVGRGIALGLGRQAGEAFGGTAPVGCEGSAIGREVVATGFETTVSMN